MKRKILFLIISIFYFPLLMNAQELLPVTVYNYASEKYVPVFYSNSNFASQNDFYNKYVLVSKKTGKDTLFVVDLIYKKGSKKIDIKQFNKKTKQSTIQTVNFDPLSRLIDTMGANPIYCIKNYRCNDTAVNMSDSTRVDILFSVVDTAKGLIYLHQLTTFDTIYHFSLDKFINSYLQPHLAHANYYWRWREGYLRDSLQNLQSTKVKIAAVSAEMMIFKMSVDSMRVILSAKQKELPLNTVTADSNSLNQFHKKLDKILLDNLYETYPINVKVTSGYTICLRDNKPIDILEKPIKKTTEVLFLSYFRQPLLDVDTGITNMKLSLRKVSVNTDSAYSLVLSRYHARWNGLHMNPSDFKTFTDSIYLALAPYRKDVPAPTIYTYQFKYSATSSWQRWIKLKDKYSNLQNGKIVEDQKLIQEFNSRLSRAKNGKYMLRINESHVNDSIFGPHIDSVYRKYKFLSHAGFSIGTFITGDEFSTSDYHFDGSLFFWNLFGIYHHVGVFAGTTLKRAGTNTTSVKYFEGGAYIAPGNYFFFKLGLAALASKVNMLVGASLIFPVFQIETGYNFALKNAYVMMGFNIPFNK